MNFRSASSRGPEFALEIVVTKRSQPLDSVASTIDRRYRAVIEAKSGSRHKYKYDPDLGTFVLHKVLPLGTGFPYDFGFIPSTKAEDGDPIDVVVFADEPLEVGYVVPCRLVGIIHARQSNGDRWVQNDRLVAIANEAQRYENCKSFEDLGENVVSELERFFVFYNQQSGKEFQVLGRAGKSAARNAIKKSKTS